MDNKDERQGGQGERAGVFDDAGSDISCPPSSSSGDRSHDPVPLDDEELVAWLAIGRTKIGNGHRVLQAFRSCGTAKALLAASHRELAAFGFSKRAIERIKSVSWSKAAEDRDLLSRLGVRIVPMGDAAYPLRLAAIARPPPILYCHGDTGLLHTPQVAMVGARSATAAGKRRAFDFAREISRTGLAITSGLARGIDTAAHRGALAAAGASVAVIATGSDGCYPAANRDLAQELARTGLVVSEFPPGTMPLATNFPRRNRIISGLALGTLVVEASVRSGSLISARLAVEEGREVFAIPGSIDNPLSRGCHALIRNGAKLVESVEDVIEEIKPLIAWPLRAAPMGESQGDEPGRLRFESEGKASIESSSSDAPMAKETGSPDDPSQTLVLEAIGYDPATLDQVVARTGIAAGPLSALLLGLELEGKVDALPGGRFVRAR